ncbi:MAG TPA: hypothetical protein VLM37_00445, partial [Fibrobacteraceae bacterium]|nr:hypothetical protein [Fibrobacteraceae bacterium]
MRLLTTLISVLSFGALAWGLDCSDPEAVGAVNLPVPRVLSSTWVRASSVHKVQIQVTRMSNKAWPSRLQLLATETPWMDHTADCRSRQQDKVASCFTVPVSVDASDSATTDTQTVFMTQLPQNRRMTLFVRALPCSDSRWPHASGWNGGSVEARVDTAAPLSQALQIRALSDSAILVSGLLPATGSYVARLFQNNLLNSATRSISDAGLVEIPLSAASASDYVVDMQSSSSARRFDLYVRKLYVDGTGSSGSKNYVIQVYPTQSSSSAVNVERLTGFREASVTLRSDSLFENMVSSLIRASGMTSLADLSAVPTSLDASNW